MDRTLSSELSPNTYGYEKAFEHFFILELYRLNVYFKLDLRLYYLRTKDHLDYYHPQRHVIVTNHVMVFADRDVDFTQLDLDASKVIYSGGSLKDPDEVARNRFDDQRLSGFKNVVVCLSSRDTMPQKQP
ncbi:MAG: hypothetical protein AAB066_04105 [Candidatus Margulisiibacteriota bacterium]